MREANWSACSRDTASVLGGAGAALAPRVAVNSPWHTWSHFSTRRDTEAPRVRFRLESNGVVWKLTPLRLVARADR